ncbi:riboflavin synthase [Acetobacterium bakii]|uniref:Riboflavin synthase n=1 Tax=Acetobacterium bakii TaxID=52689 RepID=A0A0L6U1W0_9FIRM|nr:riboflavin synthase [Acetobacterium bakii]KNZ41785.1 riboflavin synthase subunit alpha [Acetobacterium bakii]
MFTGIIEEIGKITAIQKAGKSSKLGIWGDIIFDDLKIGDSVAVNGVCLTVSAFGNKNFTADVMSESLERSELGKLKPGSFVNLERAMPANGRFGGHMVSGHIDGTGTITKMEKDENAVWVTVKAEKRILKYIIEKGSIAIDGISLTVAKLDDTSFSVSLIPHTGQQTTLLTKKVGEGVNLENDSVGKYIERFLTFEGQNTKSQNTITMDLLNKYGF